MGTGIFFASVALAVVVLFAITRDRWNCAKGLKRKSIGSALLVGSSQPILLGIASSSLRIGRSRFRSLGE